MVCRVLFGNDREEGLRAGHDKDERAGELYDELSKEGIEVLYDDREVSAGEKFADCDLIGIPNRIVISAKTGDQFELKKRTGEPKLISADELLKWLS